MKKHLLPAAIAAFAAWFCLTVLADAQAGLSSRTTPTTLSALGACDAASNGTRAVVTDATSPTYLAPIVEGGTVEVGVLCNGAAWVAD